MGIWGWSKTLNSVSQNDNRLVLCVCKQRSHLLAHEIALNVWTFIVWASKKCNIKVCLTSGHRPPRFLDKFRRPRRMTNFRLKWDKNLWFSCCWYIRTTSRVRSIRTRQLLSNRQVGGQPTTKSIHKKYRQLRGCLTGYLTFKVAVEPTLDHKKEVGGYLTASWRLTANPQLLKVSILTSNFQKFVTNSIMLQNF